MHIVLISLLNRSENIPTMQQTTTFEAKCCSVFKEISSKTDKENLMLYNVIRLFKFLCLYFFVIQELLAATSLL